MNKTIIIDLAVSQIRALMSCNAFSLKQQAQPEDHLSSVAVLAPWFH